jgi:hypothetical protein
MVFPCLIPACRETDIFIYHFERSEQSHLAHAMRLLVVVLLDTTKREEKLRKDTCKKASFIWLATIYRNNDKMSNAVRWLDGPFIASNTACIMMISFITRPVGQKGRIVPNIVPARIGILGGATAG